MDKIVQGAESMTRIIKSEDCGNSPKNIFLQELIIALARGNSKFIMESITGDIQWNIIGDRVIHGKENLAQALKTSEQVKELTIHHITSHGKAGAVNGTQKYRNGKTIAFCNVYEFSNTKGTLVKEITSYLIEI